MDFERFFGQLTSEFIELKIPFGLVAVDALDLLLKNEALTNFLPFVVSYLLEEKKR